jgi:hypothetical protein
MNELLKYKSSYALARLMVKPRVIAVYFAKQCDPQSICANKAREILILLDKKKNIPDHNERIREELWVILDHEKLLSEYNCYALAKLTLEELLRLMMKCKSNEELLCYVESIHVDMEKKYKMELHESDVNNIDLQALEHKHMGNGMKFLEQLHNTKKDNMKKRGDFSNGFSNGLPSYSF